MNVIVISKRMGRVREFELAGRWGVLLLALAVCTVLGGVFFAGVRLGGGMLMGPTAQVLEWSGQLQKQRAEVSDAKRLLQEKLDALATRIGQMNAHVIRLDALGRRLTEMAKLNKGEFNFDRPPAQGGPEAAVEGALVAAPDLTSMLDGLSAQIQDREHQLSVLESMISTRNLNLQLTPTGKPVAEGYISSYFGTRADPFNGHAAFHEGLDFAGAEGSQIVAVASGVVTWSKERFGYGLTVEINHSNGYVTRYGHCEKSLVSVGDTVQKGQPIALIGSTGRSTGPHVHFEVLKGGRAINPIAFVGGG